MGLSDLRLIANNKHSVVSEAHDVHGRVVIVKTPHANELHGWATERLANEAKMLRHLEMVQGVPALYDFFWLQTEAGLRPVLITEKMTGATLQVKRKVAARYVLSIQECIILLKGIAGVLSHVHSRGIVHSDIKLGNIMVTQDDHIALIDWGTAVVANTPPSHAHVIGTVQFMSYEQVTNQTLDGRTDMYSLGVLMTLLAYGEHLTPRYTVDTEGNRTQRSSDAIADAVAAGETIKYDLLPKPGSVIEQTFQDVLRTMTQWQRDKRFRTMRDVLRAL